MNNVTYSVHALVRKNTGGQSFITFNSDRKWVKDLFDVEPYDFGSRSAAKNFIQSMTVFDFDRPIDKIKRINLMIGQSWNGSMVNERTIVNERED
jgi:hypothetical protein